MDRVWPKLGDVLLVLLAVIVGAAAVAVSLGYGLRDAPDSADALAPLPTSSAAVRPSPTATPAGREVRVLFLGGSVVAGASRTVGTPTFGEVAAVQLGWRAEIDGRIRAGFTVDGSAGVKRIATLTPADVDAPRPDVVVIQGGEADVDAPSEELAAAITELAAALRTALGLQTRLVLVGPYSPSVTLSQQLVDVRDTMKFAARKAGLHFFDPLTSGWVAESDPAGLVNPGSRLPTSEGHLKIGRLLAADLETLKVVASTG